jgi:hypothetical protein
MTPPEQLQKTFSKGGEDLKTKLKFLLGILWKLAEVAP